MDLEPLTTWQCDTCGSPDVMVGDGYVVWRTNESLQDHDFKIMHQSRCDSGGAYGSSRSLEDFLGVAGTAMEAPSWRRRRAVVVPRYPRHGSDKEPDTPGRLDSACPFGRCRRPVPTPWLV